MLPLAVFFVLGVLAQQTFAEEPEPIVGGTAAAPGEFPHQASLIVNGQHICGGSIINPTTILTAAHCVYGAGIYPTYSNAGIRTGSTTVNQGEYHAIKRIIKHDEYADNVKQAWINDIALIILKKPIQFNQYQKPIPLADSAVPVGTQCTLSGFGLIGANGPPARNLLKMNQSVVSQATCQQNHRSMPIAPSHLCAYNRYGIGACSGDSGGPLICNGKQYGITSWSMPCAVGVPDVYTSVYHHRDFINSWI